MEIELPFGGQVQRFNTNGLCRPVIFGGRYRARFPQPLSHDDIEGKIAEGLKSFNELFDNSKILTIVNDGFRRTPTAFLLIALWDLVKDGEFIVATGTHRQPSAGELEMIFGDLLERLKPRLHVHDCNNNDSLIEYGKTSSGTRVLLNANVAKADLIFAINSIEPHFFAGFTGGRKSLIPGLAAFESVQANHRFAKDKEACTLNLATNPLHLDLEEAVSLIGDKPILAIQCVTDRDGRIVDLFSGTLQETFLKACARAAEFYTIDVPKKFDIVIANCEPPLDINLYQLQKAQEHGGLMVAPGGVLITMGACKEGTGSEYFMKLAEKYPTPQSALEKGLADDSFGIHKLVKTARQLQNFGVYYVTTLDENEVKKVYFKPFGDIKAALNSALGELDKNVEVAILDDAGYSVPVIKS